MSGSKTTNKAVPEKKPLSHGWIVVPSKTYPDRVYFYNTVTKCSTWTNPCQDTTNTNLETLSETSSSSSDKTRKNSKKSLSSGKKTKTNKLSFEQKENAEIEDYDEEHDKYFTNVPISPLKLNSSIFSPPSSPEVLSSPKSFKEVELHTHSGKEELELWQRFASSPEKKTIRKSIALSDLDKPSTSSNSPVMEKVKEKQYSTHNDLKTKSPSIESFNIRKRTRKKNNRQDKDSEVVKNDKEKILNKISFKQNDKTPAQGRLLKFKQQYSELIKKQVKDALSKSSDTSSEKTSVSTTTPVTNISSDKDPLSEDYMRRIEICNDELSQSLNSSFSDFSEEMDWEPSEELDLQNINTLSQNKDMVNVSTDILFGLTSDNISALPSNPNLLVIVLDTNILVSSLGFVRELRDTQFSGLGYPVLYIPWRVLQELDYLKDSKVNKQLNWSVRKAIIYLNENFKSRHPRFVGQSFEDFAKMVDHTASTADDEILQTCVQLKKMHQHIKVILLTTDRNFQSKSIVSDVETHSKESFRKFYLSSNSQEVNRNVRVSDEGLKQIDTTVCDIKNILKNCIPTVVETEMKAAFQESWTKVAYRKPPWTLQDAMDCFIKHWRSVFFAEFSKEALLEVEKLYEKLFKKEIATAQDLKQTIDIIQRLVKCLKKSQKSKKPYVDVLDDTIKKISSLSERLNPSKPAQGKREEPALTTAAVQFPAVENQPSILPQISEELVLENDINLVKNLFRDIWEVLRNFCCSAPDLISTTLKNNNNIPEVKQKLSVILNQMGELVTVIDGIFELSLNEINGTHPLILRLSEFLINFCPAMNLDLKSRLPICLAEFFTDMEGRTMLSGSLIDFRQFYHTVGTAAEDLNRICSGLC